MGCVFKQAFTKPIPDNAEIFSRKGERFARWTDRRGRKRTARLTTVNGADRLLDRTATFSARYRDGTGRIRTVATGCRDRDAALIVLAELERRAERVRCGALTTAEDAVLDHRATPIDAHVAAYVEALAGRRGKGGKPRTSATHVRNARARLKRLMTDCGLRLLRDLHRRALERWATARETDGMAANTINGYLLVACAFGNWLVDTKRLPLNPFARPPKRDGKSNQHRPRRALTADELRRLMIVARLRPLAEFGRPTTRLPEADRPADRQSRRTWRLAPLTFDDLTTTEATARQALANRPGFIARLEHRGRERALIYKTLVLTGLRLGELRSLTVGQLELAGRVPLIALRAADAKSGTAAEIPLRADLAADLRGWIDARLNTARAAARSKGLPLPARLPDDALLFSAPAGLVRALDRDLRAAGIPKRDDRGRTIDVHALRHTFASHLSKAGVAPRTAQAALRHSSIELTMQAYTDPRVLDVAGALNALPELRGDERPDAQPDAATGTGDA